MLNAVDEIQSAIEAESAATGKKIVAVYYYAYAVGAKWVSQPSHADSAGIPAQHSLEEMLVEVNAWAKSMDYEVIVIS